MQHRKLASPSAYYLQRRAWPQRFAFSTGACDKIKQASTQCFEAPRMQIQSFATIPLEQDEPVSAIRQFVRVLREAAAGTAHAEIDLNLIASSARGRTAVQQFRPERTKGATFERALEIAEELTNLGVAQIKSLHFILSAEGFRWKGASEGSSAKLLLLDGKSFQRKHRFDLSALLIFEANDAKDPSIEKTLGEIAKATGIHFKLQESLMRVQAHDSGSATPEEIFMTVLLWMELVEEIGAKVRAQVSLAGVPQLMTTHEAHKFLFDPARMGKSVRVDFTRIVRKWLKEEFPDYTRYADAVDGEMLHKEIAGGVVALLGVDKKPKAFSKEFTMGIGVGLTSPRFAPTPDRPFQLAVNLFQLFGIGPLPMQWTYYTEADLKEALRGAAALVKQVLSIFEPEASKMQRAHERSIGEFEGPREVSAKEAYELALPLAKAWAEDAGVMRIVSNVLSGAYLAFSPVRLPATNAEGRLAMNGGWWLQFHSRSKQENLYVTVPCHGRIKQMALDAPLGRQWPSDGDQILREGWIDSVEALRRARAAAAQRSASSGADGIQQFELSSQANVTKVWGTLRPPFREGMFPMETAWRISFSVMNEKERRITSVAVPAYGDGTASVTVHGL
jgi:hypothetical protein